MPRVMILTIAALMAVYGFAVCPADYAALRTELRAYFPTGDCHSACQDVAQLESYDRIHAALLDWMKANPGFDALDARQESYRLMQRHFVPKLFVNSPFYCECGVNGGWAGKRPAKLIDRYCWKFFKEKNLIPDDIFQLKKERWDLGLSLICGPYVDNMHHVPPFRKVLKVGFAGVRDEVAAALAKCPEDDPLGRKELETALLGLDTIHDIQLKFRDAANAALSGVSDQSSRQAANLRRIVEAAGRCPWEPPRTYFEGLNALWFIREVLAYVDGVNHMALGHPDAWLIDLYRADLKAGRITPEEAAELAAQLNIYADCHDADAKPVDGYDDQESEIQLTLGGCHADGSPVWNELTEMFLDSHLECDCVYPKMMCRFSSTSPQPYLKKIGEMLMKGHSVFTLMNDERHIPNHVSYGFTVEEARQYIGGGCWEGYLDSATDVDDSNYISLMKLVERTIYRDVESERRIRFQLEPIDDAKSWEEVRDILRRNCLRYLRDQMSYASRYGTACARVFPHPAYSMCLEGCVERRRDTTEGGTRFHPRVFTLGFIGNFVDVIAAIRQVCFIDRKCTLKEYLEVVRSNWAGDRGAELRSAAMNAPYWGDNTPFVNELMRSTVDFFYDGTEGLVNEHGGPFLLNIYAYREFMYWGNETRATPDGRRDGDRFAQGMSPSEYKCTAQATTVLNALGNVPHHRIYQSNTNLTFDPTAMNPELFAAVFRVVAKKGYHEFQPNCNDVEVLRDAQLHPERHRNLIVRVCGFSARFVSLSKRWQDEVIERHRLN